MTLPDSPAFPVGENDSHGLCKRELFAAMAMQSFIEFKGPLTHGHVISHHDDLSDDRLQLISMRSVKCADALIAELNK